MNQVIKALSVLSAMVFMMAPARGEFSQGRKSRPAIELSEVWAFLDAFFKADRPGSIKIEFKSFPDGYSKFNCATKTVFINPEVTDANRIRSLIVHEATHVILCGLSLDFNVEERSRFWDEGLATLLEYKFLNKDLNYKKRANDLALAQHRLGNLDFYRLKNWYAYSRNVEGQINNYAYGVGSSFIYFLIDTGGKKRFLSFLNSIASQRDFTRAIDEVYATSETQLLEDWLSYLDKLR